MAELKNLIVEGDTRLIGDTSAGNITATSIKTSGGTASQFVKGDGSLDSKVYTPLFNSTSTFDFSSTTPTAGIYRAYGITNPVTSQTEYGTVISGPNTGSTGSPTAQIVVSGIAGQTSPAHGYIRRLTDAGWTPWSTLLDNTNYTSYLPMIPGTGTSSVVQRGGNNTASGTYSFASGNGCVASSTAAHAEGGNTTASGAYSHAEGSGSVASSPSSHAEGSETLAGGYYSHSEGINTVADGSAAHAEGIETEAPGTGSHSEGYLTVAEGEYSHAEGVYSRSSGGGSHAEGGWAEEIDEGYSPVQALGVNSHAEGFQTTAAGICSHAEGSDTAARGNYSHAEGNRTTASGEYSHAEGYLSQATQIYAHAEGYVTNATSPGSHAEGQFSTASGSSSHAEGYSTTASGAYSHAEGFHITAQNTSEHAQGQYNVSHKASAIFGNAGNTAHSIGIGTSSASKKNAVEVMQSGDVYIYGIGGYTGANYSSARSLKQCLDQYVGMSGSANSNNLRLSSLEYPRSTKVWCSIDPRYEEEIIGERIFTYVGMGEDTEAIFFKPAFYGQEPETIYVSLEEGADYDYLITRWYSGNTLIYSHTSGGNSEELVEEAFVEELPVPAEELVEEVLEVPEEPVEEEEIPEEPEQEEEA